MLDLIHQLVDLVLHIEPSGWDFEICVPAARLIAPIGRVRPGEWPAMTAARTVLHGGYDGLAEAWAKLDAWIAQQGFTAREDLWEVYTVGPESSADPAAWSTQLTRPLASR